MAKSKPNFDEKDFPNLGRSKVEAPENDAQRVSYSAVAKGFASPQAKRRSVWTSFENAPQLEDAKVADPKAEEGKLADKDEEKDICPIAPSPAKETSEFLMLSSLEAFPALAGNTVVVPKVAQWVVPKSKTEDAFVPLQTFAHDWSESPKEEEKK